MLKTKFDGPNGSKVPAIWTDDDGVVHRAVGDTISAFDPTLILWTACGAKDVPANCAELGSTELVTCEACQLNTI